MEINPTEAFSRNPGEEAASNEMTGAISSRDAQMDDLRCVADARKGHADAFAQIVRRHQDRLFNMIYRLMGDYHQAEDLTQQAFLKAYQSLEQFRGSSSFYTWLYRIGVNVALDSRKKRSRSMEVRSDTSLMGSEEDGRIAPAAGRSSDAPAERVLSREREQTVTQAIASLDELHRSVLVLRDIEGMDYDEIAQVLSCPRGTVKSRLHRARLILRDKLKGWMQ